MKFSVTKEKLLECLQQVQNVVSTRTTLPILSNVLLQTNGSEVRLTTTDLDVGVRGSFEATIEKEGATWNITDLKDRLLYRQALETARCLQEGVLSSVHEANVGSVFGIGFPAWTGGALQFIYGMGIDTFTYRCDELANQFGDGFVVGDEVVACLKQYQPFY